MRGIVIILLVLLPRSAMPVDYYVSPGGTGNGTLTNPWPLQLALTNQAIAGGDTVWLRDGTYFPPYKILAGTNVQNNPNAGYGWKVGISGTSNNLITLRSYPGEWARLDRPWRLGSNDYLRFRDLEFFDSLKGFDSGNTNYAVPVPWPEVDDARSSSHDEWINCVLHDTNSGWSGGAAGWCIRGCIIWHVGNSALHHVCYPCPDEFSGNIIGWGACDDLNLNLRTLIVRSNIIFGTGQTLPGGGDGDMRISSNSVVAFNYIYNRYTNDVIANSIKFNGGDVHYVSNNVIVATSSSLKMASYTSMVIENNTFHMSSPFRGFAILSGTFTNGSWLIDNNHYTAQPTQLVKFEVPGNVMPTFDKWRALYASFDANSTATDAALPPDSVHVIPNQDEPKRATIAIYNFSSNDTVSVTLNGVVNAGDRYSLYSAQNYGAGAIQTGTYNGTNITVPMTNLTVAPLLYSDPIWGLTPPPPTSPEFGAFVVIGSTARIPPGAPTNLRVIQTH